MSISKNQSPKFEKQRMKLTKQGVVQVLELEQAREQERAREQEGAREQEPGTAMGCCKHH